MTEIAITKLSTKGQIVIPTKIRKIMKLIEGTMFIIEEKDNIILLKKINLLEVDKIQEPDINTIKRKIIPIFKKNFVVRAGIFGSYARGEQKINSDIDILVEFSKPISLLDFSGLKIDIEDILGKKVDLVEYNSINYLIKKDVLKEEIRII